MSTPITDRAIGFKPLHETKLIETARALERIAGELAEALKAAEFGANGYCPNCGGWEVEKGRGDKPKVHNSICPANNALARWQAMKDEATK